MNILDFFINLFKSRGVSVSVKLPSFYRSDKPMQREKDEKLSDHFGLFELTQTNNKTLQVKNRALSDEQVEKLKKLAAFMETVRSLLEAAIAPHSGYRCPELNGQTPGSSSTSQHPKCEACDFHAVGMSARDAFDRLHQFAKQGKLYFGQLIYETKGEGVWVHISMTADRPPEKCGQVMTADNGVFKLIEQIKRTA